MNKNRSEQQQVDVFEEVSAEATKDNIVTKEEKAQEKEKKEERERLEDDMRLANDPVNW